MKPESVLYVSQSTIQVDFQSVNVEQCIRMAFHKRVEDTPIFEEGSIIQPESEGKKQ